ncbi:MAG: asparagine synthase-related protein [Polyangiaceae bacterium]|nr:asparagine synthase-related protein [Polyangiaceae bacterium]
MATAAYQGRENLVLLSGGVDSCVMTAALREASVDFRCVAYRVQGTQFDETPYAVAQANHLQVPCEVIDVDPSRSIHNFSEIALGTNNLEVGNFTYCDFGLSSEDLVFAGQDTRLHTLPTYAPRLLDLLPGTPEFIRTWTHC